MGDFILYMPVGWVWLLCDDERCEIYRCLCGCECEDEGERRVFFFLVSRLSLGNFFSHD